MNPNDTKTIPMYDPAGGIDPAQDLFVIWQNSSNTYRNIDRNTILGFSGTPVDTTSTQTLQNKTLDNSNIVTLRDDRFTLQDNGDTTKQAQFQLSGITTTTTRTYTLPDNSSTLVDLNFTQTLTNKTLTSPTITSGSISNASISVDSIAEFTSGNGVTIDGLSIKDGKLNTNNSVNTANITDAAITPAKLQSSSGTSWVWQPWTPTYANITVGNGTVTSVYTQIGKTIHFRWSILCGTTTALGNTATISVPLAAAADYMTYREVIGNTLGGDVGTANYFGWNIFNVSTTVVLIIWNDGTAQGNVNFPFTESAGDFLSVEGTYEAV